MVNGDRMYSEVLGLGKITIIGTAGKNMLLLTGLIML